MTRRRGWKVGESAHQLPASGVFVPDSKVRRPRRRAGTIHREVVVERLLSPDMDVAVILAPAGFGKTTVVGQWVDSTPDPVAWMTVGVADRDPVVLMSTILAAIAAAGVRVEPPADVITGDEPTFSRRVLPQYQQSLAGISRPFVLVIDDVHAVPGEGPAAAVLVATVDALPRASRIALAGRARPGLPIARWRGQGRVVEIGVEDLAFDESETAASLTELLGRAPTQDELTRVTSRSAGWPVAVYLEAMAIRRRGGVAHDTPLAVDDFMESEVMSGLEPALSSFLVRTSVLTSLCGRLCDTVLETTGTSDDLARTESSTLLVGRLEGPGGWYRAHPLLRERLLERLSTERPDETLRLHARAARWYADEGQADEALVHAIASQDPRLIAAVGWDHGTDALMLGRTTSVRSWLDQIPQSDIERTPGLGVLAAWTGVVSGDSAEAQRWTEAAVRASGPDWFDHLDRSPHDALLALLIGLSGSLPHAEAAECCGAAAAALPVSQRTRPLAVLLHGWHLVLAGSLERGLTVLRDSHALALSMGIGTNSVEAPSLLGYIYLWQGDLRAAREMAAAARSAWVAHDLQDAAPATGLLHGLDAYLRVRGRPVAESITDLARTAPFADDLPRVMPAVAVLVLSTASRAWTALGDHQEAARSLALAEAAYARTHPSDLLIGLIEAARRDLAGADLIAAFSPAQRRVWAELSTDQTLEEIAQSLHLSRNTVKSHTKEIYRLLGVTTRRDAVRRVADPVQAAPAIAPGDHR